MAGGWWLVVFGWWCCTPYFEDSIRNGNICKDWYDKTVHSSVHFCLFNSKLWNVHLVKFLDVQERGILVWGGGNSTQQLMIRAGVFAVLSHIWTALLRVDTRSNGTGTRPNNEHDNMHYENLLNEEISHIALGRRDVFRPLCFVLYFFFNTHASETPFMM